MDNNWVLIVALLCLTVFTTSMVSCEIQVGKNKHA